MRPRRPRELSIFSMSALDLFASSLGAFILIAVVLMPFYLRERQAAEPAPVECPRSRPAPACPACPAPQPAPPCPPPPATPAAPEIADNLLVVQMEWSARSDVDLHVHTPDGEFYYLRERIAGSPGKFVLDNLVGGADSIELWKAHLPTPGRYRVCARLYRRARGVASVDVALLLDKPTGPVSPPRQTLSDAMREVCPLEFEIDSRYTYTPIQP